MFFHRSGVKGTSIRREDRRCGRRRITSPSDRRWERSSPIDGLLLSGWQADGPDGWEPAWIARSKIFRYRARSRHGWLGEPKWILETACSSGRRITAENLIVSANVFYSSSKPPESACTRKDAAPCVVLDALTAPRSLRRFSRTAPRNSETSRAQALACDLWRYFVRGVGADVQIARMVTWRWPTACLSAVRGTNDGSCGLPALASDRYSAGARSLQSHMAVHANVEAMAPMLCSRYLSDTASFLLRLWKKRVDPFFQIAVQISVLRLSRKARERPWNPLDWRRRCG